LKSLGNLDYFPDFPRPFFRVHTAAGFQIKGVQGDSACRAIFPRKDREQIRSGFETRFGARGAQEPLPSEKFEMNQNTKV